MMIFLIRLFFRQFTTREANKGIALAFLGGIAYVVEGRVEMGPDEPPVSHHAHSFFTYMQVGLAWGRRGGKVNYVLLSPTCKLAVLLIISNNGD